MKDALAASAPTGRQATLLRRQVWLVAGAAALALLAMVLPLQGLNIPHVHYLPLHTLLEFVSISAAFLVFATVWHTRTRERSSALLFIAVALFAAGWLDFFHTLSYKGMPVLVSPASVEKAVAFWLAARLIVATTLLAVSVLPRLPTPTKHLRLGVLGAYTALNLLIIWGVLFHEAELPRTYIEGTGLTPLKVGLEWLITGLLALAAWRFYRLARQSDDEFLPLIFGAAALAALGEVFFAQYTEVSDALNLLGHLYKFVSYGLIYRAMFVVGVRRPYQQLARQTETLRIQSLALESAASPILVTDLGGGVIWRNRASRDLLPPGSAGPQDRLSLFTAPVTPDPAQAAEIRGRIEAGQVWQGIVQTVDAQGRELTLRRTVTPMRNEQGAIVGTISASEDISEQQRIETRHLRVLQTVVDGFWILDQEGHILEANEAYARMSGYTLDELRGMHLTRVEAVEDRQLATAHADNIRRAGHDQFETRHRTRDGRVYPVEVSVTFDAASQNFYVFIRDRSEREQTAAMTLQLERQLQHSQKVQALGQLTGGVAHDFNNILAAILGYSNLALERFVPDKQGKLANYLREVILASERARDLIAKMLSFTRTQPSSRADVITPGAVVREVVAMMRPSIPSSIEIRHRIDSGQSIRMDPGELNQVLVNLIINARDALGDNGLIDIRVHMLDVNGEICAASGQTLRGRYLALDVSDNGSGIDAQHLPRLFDPFFTTKDVGKGTGLGLSVVHGILRRSGAHVVVHTEPGHGTLFRLLFPVVAPQPDTADVPADPALVPPGAGQRIWVVEDEPAVARLLLELLEGWGYQARSFDDPSEALAALEAAPGQIDLLLTDQTMPGMNGLELAKLARHFKPGLPVMLCTGHPDAIDAEAARQQGVRHIFGKPLQSAELAQAVAEVLATPQA